jgi:hypothetical protein
MQLDLMTKEGQPIGSARLKPFSLKNSHPAPLFLANHQDFVLQNAQRKASGVVNFTAALSGADRRNARKLVEPSLPFVELSMSALQRAPPPSAADDGWALEATLSGWVSEVEARGIWERIARAHGWRPPDGPRMVLETAVIETYFPEQRLADDLISFTEDQPLSSPGPESDAVRESDAVDDFVAEVLRAKAIYREVVFDKPPRRALAPPREVLDIS